MTNTYKEPFKGGGHVTGRDVIRVLNDADEETHDLEPGHPAYEDLQDYLPMPDEPRSLYVSREMPDVADVQHSFLKLVLGGDWPQDSVTALEALKFQALKGHPHNPVVPLQSMDPIDLAITGKEHIWEAYGLVDFNYLPELKKFYSRVKFENTTTHEKVAAYWCWP